MRTEINKKTDINKNRYRPSRENTKLLRMGVVFLSLVSFYTTANGMQEYIFTGNGLVAYAASAAIQGILLALSMNLPGYLINIWKDLTGTGVKYVLRILGKFILSILALLLTVVAIFCSSLFSYVYIANVIHKDSWGIDSELLVQQTYRKELYNAQDYAHTYSIYLEEAMGKRLLFLEEKATGLTNDATGTQPEWAEEKREYVLSEGMAGVAYMSTVINEMEIAMNKEASQEQRDLAATAVADAKTNIENRMADIQQNLTMLDSNITTYRNQVNILNTQINRTQEGIDTAPLMNSINTYLRLINSIVEQQENLQTEYRALERAFNRLPYYESLLGLSSSTSSIFIRSSLLQLQSEFFQQEPDEARMLALATDIFDSLRNAANQVKGQEKDADAYTDLLLQMNGLIRNLKDYSEIKEIESALGDLVVDLRTMEFGGETKQPAIPKREEGPEQTAQPAGQEEEEPTSETTQPIGQEDEESSVETEQSAGQEGEASSVETEQSSGQEEEEPLVETVKPAGQEKEGVSAETDKPDAVPENIQNPQWKSQWYERLSALKAQISSLPVYSEGGTENEAMGILTKSQVDFLQSYDRSQASQELDDVLRRYISTHNAIDNGILYLQSPYHSLAVFAVVLAASFDLSGFIFGIVVQNNGEESGQSNQETDGDDLKDGGDTMNANGKNAGKWGKKKGEFDGDKTMRAGWSIHKTMKKYIVLTGDYKYQDGSYVYKVFRDGLLQQCPVEDEKPYSRGIYILEELACNQFKGVPVSARDQDMRLKAQADEPQDGIYMNCQLTYDDGSLILVRGESRTFLANIDEYVPVHIYRPKWGENLSIPAKQLSKEAIKADMAVVALNSKGTRIAAIYIMERF